MEFPLNTIFLALSICQKKKKRISEIVFLDILLKIQLILTDAALMIFTLYGTKLLIARVTTFLIKILKLLKNYFFQYNVKKKNFTFCPSHINV